MGGASAALAQAPVAAPERARASDAPASVEAPEPATSPGAQGARVVWWRDGVIAGSALVGWGALWRMPHEGMGRTSCPCDAGGLVWPETLAVRPTDKGAERAADWTAAVALGAPALALSLAHEAPGTWAADALVVVQSAALAGVATQAIKLVVARPYPYMLALDDPSAPQHADPINYASFWSGHTAVPMAVATSAAMLVAQRRPDAAWRWAVWIGGPALALASGLLQVRAGNHYPSDVAAGALAGATIGGVNVWLHTF